MARRFCGNDAAGTGFARRHFAAMRPRHARVCLENEPAAASSWLSIWSSIGKTFQQCRQRLENLPDCEVSVELLERKSPTRFSNSPDLQHLEANWATPHPAPDAGTETPISAVHLAACANPEAEAVFAAREI